MFDAPHWCPRVAAQDAVECARGDVGYHRLLLGDHFAPEALDALDKYLEAREDLQARLAEQRELY